MDYEKLKETLRDNGLSEEQIAKIIDDLEAKKDDKKEEDEKKGDKPLDEGKPKEEVPPSPEEPKVEEEIPPAEEGGKTEEGKPEEPKVEEEGEPTPPEEVVPPDEAVPPVDETLPPELPPEEVPPALPPEVDVLELANKVKELTDVNEGLKSRIASLESALAAAGILGGSVDEEEVGFDEPRVPNNGSNGASDPFEDALYQLNGKRRY